MGGKQFTGAGIGVGVGAGCGFGGTLFACPSTSDMCDPHLLQWAGGSAAPELVRHIWALVAGVELESGLGGLLPAYTASACGSSGQTLKGTLLAGYGFGTALGKCTFSGVEQSLPGRPTQTLHAGAHYVDASPEFTEKRERQAGNPLQRLSRTLNQLAGSLRLPSKDSHPKLQD